MFLRSIALAITLALGLAACSQAPSEEVRILGISTADAAQAARIISAYRVAHGLTPVTVNQTLNKAAAKAAELQVGLVVRTGKLNHGNFSGRMYEFRVRGAAAENLTAGSDAVAEAIERWKKSPGHNENLLMREAREIGLAKVTAPSGYRTYWALVLTAPQGDANATGLGW